ncbi:MAG: DsrE family protein [Planctomycetes bacterium]|nr:DsrE family protein [Planctomycetota bacterium]
MKLLVTLSAADPETAFNAFRLASFARAKGDAVSVFLIGKGVDFEHAADDRFDARGQAEKLLSAGGSIQACGTCLKIRNSNGSEVCPLSTMQTLYDLIAGADRVVSF